MQDWLPVAFSSFNFILIFQGVSAVGSYEPIEVSEYDNEELLQCLKYYKHKGLFSRGMHTMLEDCFAFNVSCR